MSSARRNQAMRVRRKAAGMCVLCGVTPPGRKRGPKQDATACEGCREIWRIKWLGRKEARMEEAMAA